jgi:hypothetical protein
MKRLRRGTALAVVALAIAVTLAGCGGSSGSGGSSSDKKTTYNNAAYGFAITYGDPLSLVPLTPTQGEDYAIAFADKGGAVVNDEYANGIRVAVNKMAAALKPSDVPKLKNQIAKAVETMIVALPGGKMTGKVTAVTLNGTPGFAVDYTFTKGGQELTCRTTILAKGKNEYDLTEQALTKDWSSLSPTLDQTVQTFTVD